MFDKIVRREMHRHVVAFLSPRDLQWIAGGLVVRKGVEHAGNLQRNSGSHKDVIDTGEHRSVDGGQMGDLDFLQIIHADGVVVTFASEKDLDEVSGDTEFL